jgi:hypothetical protein
MDRRCDTLEERTPLERLRDPHTLFFLEVATTTYEGSVRAKFRLLKVAVERRGPIKKTRKSMTAKNGSGVWAK